jgi:dihydroorotate dehydrogenase electron transfer subunit
MQHPTTRNTIYSETAEILSHQAHPANQYVIRLYAPRTAVHSRPGSFIHLQCDKDLSMRRPMSIMRVDSQAGWIDILYKIHGIGTGKLSRQQAGTRLELLGPIGVHFKVDNYKKFPLLIGGGVGIPPMIYLAEHIKKSTRNIKPLVLMGSEIPFPFQARPSQIMINGCPEGVIATMPLLEDWGLPCRLASLQDYPGCYEGYVTDLARLWLNGLDTSQLAKVEIFSCGPTAMLESVSKLAHDFNLPCQISVEEYMACAVGGCAGCAIKIYTSDGPAMKRVCVDGPVFEVSSVYSY